VRALANPVTTPVPNATASSTTTYETFTATARRPLGWALVACALGVLQACSGGDALAPEAVGSLPQSAPQTSNLAAPQIHALSSDTATVAGSHAILGSHLPTALGSLRVQVDGVDARIVAQSSTRLEWQLPADAFPCAAPQTRRLSVSGQGIQFEAKVLVHTARRLSLDPNSPAVELKAADATCIELAAPADHANAKYLIAVVNPNPAHTNSTPTTSHSKLTAAVAATEASTHLSLVVTPAPAPSASGVKASVASALAVSNIGAIQSTVPISVPVSGCSSSPVSQTRTAFQGTSIRILEDLTSPHAQKMDKELEAIGREFDQTILPLIQQHFGNPLALDHATNRDRRITLVLTKTVNDSLPGTAAFVSACNFHPRRTFAASNEDEVIFARVPAATERPSDWRRAMRATLVHETKHLASYAERIARGTGFEEPWLEEATARVAEELYARTFIATGGNTTLGYEETVGCELRHCDERPLVMFKHFSALHDWLRNVDRMSALGATQLTAMHYASGWSFVRWALDHSANERATLRALATGTHGSGLEGLAALTGMKSADMVTQWMSDLAANVEGAEAAGRSTWNVAAVLRGMAQELPGAYDANPLRATRVMLGEDVTLTDDVLPLSTRYIALNGTHRETQRLSLAQPAAVSGGGLRIVLRRLH
jgi:hypothetical protein